MRREDEEEKDDEESAKGCSRWNSKRHAVGNNAAVSGGLRGREGGRNLISVGNNEEGDFTLAQKKN